MTGDQVAPGSPWHYDSVVQIAYLVPDLERAARWWFDNMNTGPFLRRRHVPVTASHDGGDAVYDHSIALAQWGCLMLELIEVHDVQPAGLADDVRTNTAGVHHVAVFVRSVPEARNRAQARGWRPVLDLVTAAGDPVTFVDARADVGHLIEYYVPTERMRGLYARVAAHRRGPGVDVIKDL